MSLPRPRTPLPRLHVLTPSWPTGPAPDELDDVLAAGAPLVQVRVKGRADRDVLAMVRDVVARVRDHGATGLVNDRVDLALAAAADGVHLGAEDLPVADARRLADRWEQATGDRVLVGGTARDADGARALVEAGADYLGVGPCYASRSKTGLPPPGGPARVARVAAAVDVPLVAIGGVEVDHVPELLDAGAHGVAVIGAVWSAPDPGAAVARFLDVLGAP